MPRGRPINGEGPYGLALYRTMPGGEAQIVGDQSQSQARSWEIPNASLGTVPVTTKQTCIDSLELPHELLLHTSLRS
jgi:hypothetical protein